MSIIEAIKPLELSGVGTALLCGFIVGTERQLAGKPAGIRTSSLICLGAYCFVVIGSLISENQEVARIVAQIITGIGFIGAGVILAREGSIIGVTSAAVIWVLAGIGILIGFDRYLSAIFLSLITVAILTGVNMMEKVFAVLRRGAYNTLQKNQSEKTRGLFKKRTDSDLQ